MVIGGLSPTFRPPASLAAPAPHWVGTWETSPQLIEPNNMPPAPGLADTTLRQVIHVTLGGRQMRVVFSNAYGSASVSLLNAHVAVSAGGSAIRPDTDKALTFHGAASVTIPPGAPILSDPLDFPLAPQSDLTITLYVRDPAAQVTGHPGSRATSYLAPGNAVSALSLPNAQTVTHWYYLFGVDVAAEPHAAAVVALGDSITDGRGSTTDGNDRWPDTLARRLLTNRETASVAVLNAGIGGNHLLHDGLGPSALARLDRDVLAQPGVRWMILFEGINDLGGHAPAQDVIGADAQIIARAHARDIRVYGATITPCGASFYASPELEAARQAMNTWMRTSGSFDGVIDFDAAVRDPNNPSRLRADADGGDHLHLNPLGYRRMAGAVDLSLFASNK